MSTNVAYFTHCVNRFPNRWFNFVLDSRDLDESVLHDFVKIADRPLQAASRRR
jgi:hypothetical protein